MKALILIALITLQGCSVFEPIRSQPLYSEVTARVILTDDMPNNVHGVATWSNNICTIHLRRSKYPYCMAHELRHCFEHNWHDDRPNNEDCMTQ